MNPRRFWLFAIILMFLPNLGVGGGDQPGSLEMSDYMLVFVLLTGTAAAFAKRDKLVVDRLMWIQIAFVFWMLLGTLTIPVRYPFAPPDRLAFSLIRVARFVAYLVVGHLVIRALAREVKRDAWEWAILGITALVSASLWVSRSERDVLGRAVTDVTVGYAASNSIAVVCAVLLAYVTGVYLSGYGSQRWRTVASPTILILLASMTLTHGRGGIIAAIVALLYVAIRSGVSARVFGIGVVISVALVAMYFLIPEFKIDVDGTLNPVRRTGYEEFDTVAGGVDDSGRLRTWTNELAKLPNSPIIGTGFWNRGAVSGLWTTGAHNQYIQIFLETGIVGGVLYLFALLTMWRDAGSSAMRRIRLDIPVKGALVAVFVSGMSEVYFNAATPLFVWLLAYAPAGAVKKQRQLVHGRVAPLLNSSHLIMSGTPTSKQKPRRGSVVAVMPRPQFAPQSGPAAFAPHQHVAPTAPNPNLAPPHGFTHAPQHRDSGNS